MKKNLKFSITIECSKREKDWNINVYFNSTNIYNEIFFII